MNGGDVRIGVRIGPGGQVLSGQAVTDAPAPAANAGSDDYWAKFSGGGQKLR